MSLSPLHLRPFRHLLAAYGAGQLGGWAGEVALAVAVYATTHSALAVAATWVVHRCVAALAAPVLVTRIEHGPRGRVLAGIALVQATLYVALAAAVSARAALPIVLGLLALDGAIAPASRALTRASVVTVTQAAGLHREGNALINLVFTFNGVLAPALGGLLVASLGPESALAASAGAFLLCSGVLATAGLPGSAATPAPHGSAVARLRASIEHVRREPLLARLFTMEAALATLLAMILPIEVVFITDTLGASDAALGIVLTAWGAGMVVGGVVLTRLASRPIIPVLLAAAAIEGVGTVAMGLSPGLTAVIAASLVGGIGNGIYGMAFVTAFQERTAAAHQARVNGLYDMLMSVMPGLGFALGGLVAVAAAPRVVYLVSGLGALAVAAWVGLGLRRVVQPAALLPAT